MTHAPPGRPAPETSPSTGGEAPDTSPAAAAAAAFGGGVALVHPPRVRRLLVGLVLAVIACALVGAALLRPTGEAAAGAGGAGSGAVVDTQRAEVLGVTDAVCEGTPEDRLPDGQIPLDTSCPTAEVRLEGGADDGATTSIAVPAQVVRGGLDPGTQVDLAYYPPDDVAGVGATYVWVDFSRTTPLAVVVVLLVVVVVAVGRRQGIAALGGLVVAYLTIIGFIVPALLEGRSPALVTLSAATAIMAVVLYLTHGFSLKTTAAYLGTVLGLVLTAGLAVLAVDAVRLRGLDDDDSYLLAQMTGTPDLSGLVLAGMVIAGLGVLNDVTITQASGVFEFREHSPGAGFRQLFASGMRLGRDHLASTIYTVAFAYAGAALPTLVIIHLYGQPFSQVVTSSVIAEEVVRTAVGAIGLVVAIPFTTAVAAAAVASAGVVDAPRHRDRSTGGHAHAH